jgi:hypothetical protein
MQLSSPKLMENKNYILALFALLTCPFVFSQIVSGEKDQKVKNEKKNVMQKAGQKPARELDNQTSIYFNTNWSNTFRSLKSSGGLFGEEVGKRADEKSANFWSFGIGIRSELSKHFRFSIGLDYLQNGEKYSFNGTDSTFKYTTSYRYVAMPLVLDFVHGADLKFNIGVGIAPQMLMRYKQQQDWINSVDAKGAYTDKVKGTDQRFNQMIVSAVFRAGVNYKYGEFWSMYFIPEARFQIPNTYGKNAPYVQKAMAIGFNLGLTYQL